MGWLFLIMTIIETTEFLIRLGNMVSFASSIRDYEKALSSYERANELLKKYGFD